MSPEWAAPAPTEALKSAWASRASQSKMNVANAEASAKLYAAAHIHVVSPEVFKMDDNPRNVLEIALTRGREKFLSMQTILWVFASSTIYVPSGSDPGEDLARFQPILFERDGTQMIACYSELDRGEGITHIAPYMVTMTGLKLLTGVPSDQGIVLNPGSTIGFDIAPQGISALRGEIGR